MDYSMNNINYSPVNDIIDFPHNPNEGQLTQQLDTKLPALKIEAPDETANLSLLKGLKKRVKHIKDYQEATITDLELIESITPRKAPRKNWKTHTEEKILQYLNDRYDEDTVFNAGDEAYSYACAVKGPKEQMQDRHCSNYLTIEHMTGVTKNIPFYGLFDGHGDNIHGDECAEFLLNNFATTLAKKLQLADLDDSSSITKAINAGFLEVDALYRESTNRQYVGSTALVAFILDGILWIANAGDSRAVLSKNGEVSQLTRDAVPTTKIFKSALEKRGWSARYFWKDTESQEIMCTVVRPKNRLTKGAQVFPKCVNKNRSTEPTVSCARTMGDKMFKGVSPLPKVTRLSLDDFKGSDECYLIMASDGLWDVVGSKESADILNDTVQNIDNDSMQVKASAEALVKAGFESGAYDNTTVQVIKLKTPCPLG